jgi:hypothetical protein
MPVAPLMRSSFRFLSLTAVAASLLAAAACGDDDNVVRERLDASVDATADAGEGGTSECGAAIPTTYEAPEYVSNAATELAARQAFDAFMKPMKDFETGSLDGGTPAPVTATSLAQLYATGSPSVRAITSVYYQGRVDAWIADYEPASAGGTYEPSDPPPQAGGTLANSAGTSVWVFNPRGIDLRQAIEKGLYNAAFYNHAVAITAPGQDVTPATMDRLVAAFGAHPSFQNDHQAAENKDVNAAGYAARRDSKDPSKPGPYQRARAALIKAKAAAAAGEACVTDRDEAIRAFLLEWEKSQYATVIYYANKMQSDLSQSPQDPAVILHAHGEVLGFVAGFRTIDPSRRKITDEQIDALLVKLHVPNGEPARAYELITGNLATVTGNLAGIISDITAIYELTPAEVADFKVNFTKQ